MPRPTASRHDSPPDRDAPADRDAPRASDPRETCVWIPAPDRAFLAVRETDRAGFLQAMLTQDVTGRSPGEVRPTALLDRKGHLVATGHVWILEDEILLETDRARAEALRQALESRIIMDRVAITPLEGQAAWLVGPGAGARLRAAVDPRGAPPGTSTEEGTGGPGLEPRPGSCTEREIAGGTVLARGMDWPGVEGCLLATRDAANAGDALDRVRAALERGGGRLEDAPGDALEVRRIEAGIPRFGADMDEGTLALEARLEDRAIGLAKGCYLGQEVVARTISRGRVQRRLCGVIFEGGLPAAGEPLEGVRSEEGAEGDRAEGEARERARGARAIPPRPAGRVTSAVRSPRFGAIGLAMVRRAWIREGTRLRTRGGIEATVVALPFRGRATQPPPPGASPGSGASRG